jgi:hypothetical protein
VSGSLAGSRYQAFVPGPSYERLDVVRVAGDWEGWLGFFLDGVAELLSRR